MIRRLYVDNFRSLVDFTWEPGKETLVLGYNGSGKTSVFDLFDSVRRWTVGDRRIDDAIHSRDLTLWRSERTLLFECDIDFQGRLFSYGVKLDWSDSDSSPRVIEEKLHLDRGLVFNRLRLEVMYTTVRGELDSYAVPLGQSALAALSLLPAAEFVRTFVSLLSNIIVVRPTPPMVSGEADRTDTFPSPRFENFVAWYWHQTSSGAFTRAMDGRMEEVWEEFDYFGLLPAGRTSRTLSAIFKRKEPSSGEATIDLQQMSDGERMLTMLYSLAAYQQAHNPTTIIIDEPDNYVSLLELQPWLLRMLNDRPDEGQIILISHNPEIIQTMGPERVAYFSREDHLSPTKVSSLPPDETGLPLSELMARGWIDA